MGHPRRWRCLASLIIVIHPDMEVAGVLVALQQFIFQSRGHLVMTSAARCVRSLASAMMPPEHEDAASSTHMSENVPGTRPSAAASSADRSVDCRV